METGMLLAARRLERMCGGKQLPPQGIPSGLGGIKDKHSSGTMSPVSGLTFKNQDRTGIKGVYKQVGTFAEVQGITSWAFLAQILL
jgi:hypothetical protein